MTTSSSAPPVGSLRREAAVFFLQLSSSGKVREAFDRYIAPTFRHHNPYFRGDAASLAAAMAENAQQNPDKVYEVQHVLEDGDLVAVHGRARLNAVAPEMALVHIFRFENDRVVELWDIAQPAPSDSPNDHGMF